MPGEQPLGEPAPTTGLLQAHQASHASGRPSRPPTAEDSTQACRTTKDTREVGSGVQVTESHKAPLGLASDVAPRALNSPWPPGKGCSPRGPPGKGPTQTRARRPGRGHGGPQQLYRLSPTSTKDRQAPDAASPGPGTGAPHTPSLPRTEALPANDQLFQRCFPDTPSSFTNTDYTSPSPAPGPPALKAPESQGPSPSRPPSYLEFPGGRADSWPPNTENFPAANFGVPSTEPEPFPVGSGPSPSPGVVPFQYPFSVDTDHREFTKEGAVAFAFRPTASTWPEQTVGSSPAYTLSTQAPPPLLPCYGGPADSLEVSHDLSRALSSPVAAPSAPSPFPADLHKSLPPGLPEQAPSAHNGSGSPKGLPNPLPTKRFLGKAYDSPGNGAVGTSPGPLDKELAAPGCTPTPRPQLWEGASESLPLVDTTPAPYHAAPPVPPAARGSFFEGQRLCLPHSPPLPWAPMLPATRPGPAPMELLSRLPYPTGGPEWPASSHTPGPAEKLAVARNGQGTPSSSPPVLFPYSGLQDTSGQPLFFGVTPHQASPLGTPGLPPPRGVGASPSESPLPSPATTAAGSSSCSSLSPLSSSPANPSSEDGQLPGPLGPTAFFQHPTHPQEGSGTFPPVEPLPAIHVHYQPELPKAFPFSTEALGSSRAFECLATERGALGTFPREPPPYSAHHFPLSSASLDQLDVLLTCRQCDRNYSNLNAFLQHRQFCGLLPRAPGGSPQPPTPRAPADSQPPSSLGTTKLPSFLLDGDGLHGLATTPLPLPASDLDLEDVAKLDSLITEALNGLQDPSDTPEIDSSFIDVFADEDTLGPRVPSTGQPLRTRAATTPEPKAQNLLPAPAPTPQTRAPSPGAEGCPPHSRPDTRSRGPVHPQAGEGSTARRPRRGKRLRLFQEGPVTTQDPSAGSRTVCLRPRRKGGRVEPPPPQGQGLRGHRDTGSQIPGASPIPMQTRSSQRTACSKHGRKRARGGRWSKELIHRIVQQKNELHRQRARRGRSSLLAERPTLRLRAHDHASASEEDQGSLPGYGHQASKGRPRLSGRRQKRKEARGTLSPREEAGKKASQRLVGRESGAEKGSLALESLGAAATGPLQGPHPIETESMPQAASTESPEENRLPLGFSPEPKPLDVTPEASSDAIPLQEVPSSPPAPEQLRPGPEDPCPPQPPGCLARMGPRACLPPAGTDTWPRDSPDQPEAPSFQPGVSTAKAEDAIHPISTSQLLKSNSPGWESPHCHGPLLGVPVTQKGTQPRGIPHRDSFFEPKELASPCSKDLCSQHRAPDRPGSSVDCVHSSPLRTESPGNSPYPAATQLGDPHSPLTLESTSLFSRLPEDGFHPLTYDSLLEHKDHHTPFTCTGQSPPSPLQDPPDPEKTWPLLEEMSHFSGLPQERTCGQRCPRLDPAVPSPSSPPGKGGECGALNLSSPPEEELEIKRLVTELESQLQTSTAGSQAPTPLETEPEGVTDPRMDTCRPPTPPASLAAASQQDTLLPDGFTGLERSHSLQKDCKGTEGNPKAEALGSSFRVWTVALEPGVQEDAEFTTPVSPPRARHRAHSPLQIARVQRTASIQTGREGRVPLGVTLPDPAKLLQSPMVAASVTEHSPHHKPRFPRSKEATETQPSGGPLLLHPRKCRGDQCPEPVEAGEPGQDTPKSEVCHSPTVFPVPGMVAQDVRDLPLGTKPLLGAPQEHSVGNLGSKPGDMQPVPVPSPACMPDPGPGSRPPVPAPSPLYQLQLLVARAAELKEAAQSPQPSEPKSPGGDSARSQASEGGIQEPVGATERPEADGHLDSTRQAKSWTPEPSVKGQGSCLQPEEQKGHPTVKAKPEAALTMPLGGTAKVQELPERGGAAWSHQGESGNPLSPIPTDREALALTIPQNRHETQAAGTVASLGLRKLLLSAEGSPVCPIRGPAHSSASAAPLKPCSPKHLPQEGRPSVPSGTPGAQGEPGVLFPAPPSFTEGPCPLHPPASSSLQTLQQRASCAQSPAAAPLGDTSPHCPWEGLVGSSPPVNTLPGEQTSSDVTPAHGGHCFDSSLSRTLGDFGNPVYTAPSPPVGTVSPSRTGKAPGHHHVSAANGTEVARGLGTPDPRVASPGLCCPSTDPQRNTVPPDPGKGQNIMARAMDMCLVEATEPDPHCYLRQWASSQGQEGPESPSAGYSIAPQSDRHPHPAPSVDPLCSHDPKQKPLGFRKKSQSSGYSQKSKEDPSPEALPGVTCDICGASFRSRPGLNRHKARKHRRDTSLPCQAVLPTQEALQPTANTPHVPRKKGHQAPAREKPKTQRKSPSLTSGSCGQGSAEAGQGAEPPLEARLSLSGAPGSSHHPELQTPGTPIQGTNVTPRAPRSRKSDKQPEPAVPRGAQRQSKEPGGLPSDLERPSARKGRRGSGRKFWKKNGASDSENCPDVIPDSPCSNPSNVIANYPARPQHHLSTEGEQEMDRVQPRSTVLGAEEETVPGALSYDDKAKRSPLGDLMTSYQAGQDAESGSWGERRPELLGVVTELSPACGRRTASDSRPVTSQAGERMTGEPLVPPKTLNCSSQGFLESPEAGAPVQGLQDSVPRSSSPQPGPLMDGEVSITQLLLPGDRLTQKKVSRVPRQRGKKPKPPLPPEPPGQVVGPASPYSAHLPADLSEGGSRCLSREDPWIDKVSGLPKAFLTNGFLSSNMPRVKPWVPDPSLWLPEHPKGRTSPSEETVPGPHPDELSQGLPELHRVSAAWPGLDLQRPAEETPFSMEAMSPEPPSLEREGSDSGPPGSTGLDLGVLSAKFEMQDLCLLGPCEDSGAHHSPGFLGVQTGGVSSQVPEVAGRGLGRDRPARGKRGAYKCRVCFRRFGGLGELDLHKQTHSPSPPPTCYMCVQRRFGSRQLLREHLREKHGQGSAGLWACGMCLRQVPDVWMYNEHLREHAVRFARRGQTLTALGDPPGSALLGRGRSTIPEASGDPEEAQPKVPRASPSYQGAASVTPGPSGSATPCPSPPPGPWPPGAPTRRAAPVHTDCKDCSRHCHHCGKRFPKPCKLQRHLAVHSPQRVFLCPQCPGVYGEHGQLLAHRSREHGASGEPERPPTPLYACELCATVMRIIKRAFVCSTCNYTFSKKEQFDRHMDKHHRPGQQPFSFRSVRRPGGREHKIPAPEGGRPHKRRRVTVASGSPEPSVDKPQSQGSSPAPGAVFPPALHPPCPEPAPSTVQGQAHSQERPLDTQGHSLGADDPPPDFWGLPPSPLSPFPAPPAGGEAGQEHEVPPSSLTALPLNTVPSLARDEDTEEKKVPLVSSGKLPVPGIPSKGKPTQKEKKIPRNHKMPKGGPGNSSHKGVATKAGYPRASSEGRSSASTPSKGPTAPASQRKAVQSLVTPGPGRDAEDRPRYTIPKIKPAPSSQETRDPQHCVTEGGGSQPQPASGQLQSETATTPAKLPCPGQSPPPAKPPPQTPAKGHSQGPGGATEQGPRESMGGSVGKRRGRTPGPTRTETLGSQGRAPLVSDRPLRNPRKQPAPSRVLPTKPGLGIQADKPLPQPTERRRGAPGPGLRGFRRRREGLGMAASEKRSLHGNSRKGRGVPICPRTLHTAESQNHLLSQLFGQRLTGFKIPLKRESAE
ncbi:zinc finger protein 469 [Rhynchocyon petersi]